MGISNIEKEILNIKKKLSKKQVFFYNSSPGPENSLRPAVGCENVVYIDVATGLLYVWNGTTYTFAQVGGSSVELDPLSIAKSGITNLTGNVTVNGATTYDVTINADVIAENANNINLTAAQNITTGADETYIFSNTSTLIDTGNGNSLKIDDDISATSVRDILLNYTSRFHIIDSTTSDVTLSVTPSLISTDTPILAGDLSFVTNSTFTVPKATNDAFITPVTNGSIYYNTLTEKFRIFENGFWRDMSSANTLSQGDTSIVINDPATGAILFTVDGVPVGQVALVAGMPKWTLNGILDPSVYQGTALTFTQRNAIPPQKGYLVYTSDTGFEGYQFFDGTVWKTVSTVLTKADIGLGNVDNTSDLNKPISLATQAALNLKEDLINKSTNVLLDAGSDIKYPSVKAIKDYTDLAITTATPDATTATKGKIQLAGDLSGTASAPTVPGLATKENNIVPGAVTDYFRGDKTWQLLDKNAVGLSNVDNTSDLNKPISIATQTALNTKQKIYDPQTISTSSNLLTWETIYNVNSATPTTQTLPDALNQIGKEIVIKNTGAIGSGSVSVLPAAGNTLNGASILLPGDAIKIVAVTNNVSEVVSKLIATPLDTDTLLPWSANSSVVEHAERFISIAGVNVSIRSLSQRTTTPAFDATEAGSWNYTGQSVIQPFPPNTLVIAGFQIVHDGQTYQSNSSHLTGATFNSVEQALWLPLSTSVTPRSFVSRHVTYVGMLSDTVDGVLSVKDFLNASFNNRVIFKSGTSTLTMQDIVNGMNPYTITNILYDDGLQTANFSISTDAARTLPAGTYVIYVSATNIYLNCVSQTKSPVELITATTTLNESNKTVLIQGNIGNYNITLPSTSIRQDSELEFISTADGIGEITLLPNGSNTVDSTTSYVIKALLGTYVKIKSIGSNWYILNDSAKANSGGSFVVLSDYPVDTTLPVNIVDDNNAIVLNQTSTPSINITLPPPTDLTKSRTLTVTNRGVFAVNVDGMIVNSGNTALFTLDGSTWKPVRDPANDVGNIPNSPKSQLGTFSISDRTNGWVFDQFIIDEYSAYSIAQTTPNAAFTLPAPTNSSGSRLVSVGNTGTVPFTIYGQQIEVGKVLMLLWTGSTWLVGTGGSLPIDNPFGRSAANTAVLIPDKPTGGAIGTAALTVDASSYFVIDQSTANQTLTLPLPLASSSRSVIVRNTGTVPFTMYGQIVQPSTEAIFSYNTFQTTWVYTGVGNAVPLFAGSTPVLENTDRHIDIGGVEVTMRSDANRTTSATFTSAEALDWRYVSQSFIKPFPTNTVVLAGFQIIGGDGRIYRSNTTRTTGASFNATEQLEWTPLSPLTDFSETTQIANATGATTVAAWNSVVTIPTLTSNITLNLPTTTVGLGKKITFIRTGTLNPFTISIVPFAGETLSTLNSLIELNAINGALTLEAIDATNVRQVSNIGAVAVAVPAQAVQGQIQAFDRTADFNDWILLDGRLKSTLTAAQQAVATSLGYGTNIPDMRGRLPIGAGGTAAVAYQATTGSTTIAQSNLPNVTLNGTTSAVSAGTPSGTISNTVNAIFHSATGDGWNGGRIQLTDRSSFTVTNPSELTVSSSFSGSTLPTHSHPFTTSSINGGVAQQSYLPPVRGTNYFVWLGANATTATAQFPLSLTTTGTGAATYNAGTGVMNVPTPIPMVGATAGAAGAAGYVPAPIAGQQNFVLRGDGTWGAISSSPALSALTAATAVNAIDNGSNTQNWAWNSPSAAYVGLNLSSNSMTTGSLLTMSNTSSALNPTDGLLSIQNNSPSVAGTLLNVRSSSSNTVDILNVMTAGNVGIGTKTFNGTNPEKLLVDVGATATTVNAIKGTGSINSYLQLNIQNNSAGTNASSDVVATANNGSETTNYVDMGINSSGYTGGVYGAANDAYLYNMGNNLLIGTGTAAKDLIFMSGGTAQATNERMRISGTNGYVGVGTVNPLTNLDVIGSQGMSFTSVSGAAYTVAVNDRVVNLLTIGTQDVTLPSATTFNRRVLTFLNKTRVSKIFTSNYVDVSGNNIAAIPAYSVITLQATGGIWHQIDGTGFESTPITQSFTANGTYTPIVGAKYYEVEMVGGGGGGGAALATGAFQVCVGGGGGAGGYIKARITAVQMGTANLSVVVGTGGNSGAAGTASTFGALLTANGGAAGSSGGVGTASVGQGGAGGSVSLTTMTDIGSITGGSGSASLGYMNGSQNLITNGNGGSNKHGEGSPARTQQGTGVPSSGGVSALIGTGGGATGGFSANGGAAATGGVGGSGKVIVTAYFN